MSVDESLTEIESPDVLKGTALDIYRHLLKANGPLGIREIQRTLNLSSPSVAQHHLTRLERAGLVKREWGNYVINRVVLDCCIKVGRFIIPRHFFYSLIALFAIVFELTLLPSHALYEEYFCSVILTTVFLLIFCYETIRVWRKGRL